MKRLERKRDKKSGEGTRSEADKRKKHKEKFYIPLKSKREVTVQIPELILPRWEELTPTTFRFSRYAINLIKEYPEIGSVFKEKVDNAIVRFLTTCDKKNLLAELICIRDGLLQKQEEILKKQRTLGVFRNSREYRIHFFDSKVILKYRYSEATKLWI